jgi:hypothetical protein
VPHLKGIPKGQHEYFQKGALPGGIGEKVEMAKS